jgi:hypothetical protein
MRFASCALLRTKYFDLMHSTRASRYKAKCSIGCLRCTDFVCLSTSLRDSTKLANSVMPIYPTVNISIAYLIYLTHRSSPNLPLCDALTHKLGKEFTERRTDTYIVPTANSHIALHNQVSTGNSSVIILVTDKSSSTYAAHIHDKGSSAL